MSYLGFDFETQGFNPKTDAPTEIALLEFDEEGRILSTYNRLIFSPLTRNQTQEIVELTGITDKMLKEEAIREEVVAPEAHEIVSKAKAIFAHNAKFDRSFLEALFSRNGLSIPEVPYICTLHDVEYPKKFSCKKLSHLAFDHGIVSPEGQTAHRAVADVELMIRLITRYGVEKILKRSTEPKVLCRILPPPPWEDKRGNEVAKELGFRFDPDTKYWLKTVYLSEVEELTKSSPYKIIQLKGKV